MPDEGGQFRNVSAQHLCLSPISFTNKSLCRSHHRTLTPAGRVVERILPVMLRRSSCSAVRKKSFRLALHLCSPEVYCATRIGLCEGPCGNKYWGRVRRLLGCGAVNRKETRSLCGRKRETSRVAV